MRTAPHAITVSKSGRFDGKPIFIACVCGTQGDFRTVDEAGAYVKKHWDRRGPFTVDVSDGLRDLWLARVGEFKAAV